MSPQGDEAISTIDNEIASHPSTSLRSAQDARHDIR
jgi:hypothetical protein